METGTRALVWLRNAVLGVFVAALLGGILLPIYSDEIGWRLQERAGFDGVDKLYTELCGPNTVVTPPFWMMPVRYYSALFNGLFPDPLYVRLSGILYALVWTMMLLWLIRRATDGAWQRIIVSTLALGFLSLGTMPLLLVWSRPEQPILLAFTGAMLIAGADWNRGEPATPARTAWLRSLAILLLALVAMSYHIKAIFGVPLFLTCLFLAARGRAAHVPRLVVAAILTAAAAWAAYYWIHRLQCPNDPAVRADFVRNNTGAALISVTDWWQVSPLIGKALNNISVFQYLGMPAPREEPMSHWLPYHRIDFAHSFAWFLVIVAAWAAALTYAAGCLFVAARRSWREHKLDGPAALALVLVVTVLGWSASQGFRNIYEACFVVPLMVLAATLALATHDGGEQFRRGITIVTAGVGLLGIVSVASVAAIYGPPLVHAAGERGYIAEQPYSIGNFGYSSLRRDMLAAARKCGITDPDSNHALLIDDVTYFAFMKSRMPQHRQGLLSAVVAKTDPIAYLKRVKSDGIITSCRVLPPALRARAKSEGQFCCLGPPGW